MQLPPRLRLYLARELLRVCVHWSTGGSHRWLGVHGWAWVLGGHGWAWVGMGGHALGPEGSRSRSPRDTIKSCLARSHSLADWDASKVAERSYVACVPCDSGGVIFTKGKSGERRGERRKGEERGRTHTHAHQATRYTQYATRNTRVTIAITTQSEGSSRR